jgi:hypothetical protein
MAHIRLTDHTLGEAFEKASSRLENCNELGRRSVELFDRFAARMGEGPITEDERATLEAEFAASIDKHNDARQRVEMRMRAAGLARQIHLVGWNPRTGKIERVLDLEEWNRVSFGVAGLDTFADDVLSPSPGMEGEPRFLEPPGFDAWLDAQQPETGASGIPQSTEPEPAKAEPTQWQRDRTIESAPGTKSKRGRHQYDFWPEVENYIFELLVEHGPPSLDDPQLPNQKALEERVSNFMQQRGWDAAESTVREHVVGMLEYRGKLGR